LPPDPQFCISPVVGYRRYKGVEAAAILGRLYAVLRLFVNFFQPSFKLASKMRAGAKVSKTYHPQRHLISVCLPTGGSARKYGNG
jgi:hypothetical protein